MEQRLLSVPELCRYLSMPRRTVYGYIARGRFPAGSVRRIGRALRFEKSAIDAWVSAQPTSAALEAGPMPRVGLENRAAAGV